MMKSVRARAWALRLLSLGAIFLVVLGQARAAVNEFDPSQVRSVPGLEEALVASGQTTAAENSALDAAIQSFRAVPAAHEDFAQHAAPLAAFAVSHPRAPWNTSIYTNLGLGYYRAGYFSQAIDAFKAGWEAGKSSADPTVVAIAERALGEWAVMYARIGEREKLQEVLKQSDGREIRGPAIERLASARESVWTFDNEPEGAFMCGPKALKNLLKALKASEEAIRFVDQIKSPPSGFTMAQISAFAQGAALTHRVVRRQPGSPVPYPSIIHWKVSHFAAVLEETGGRYRVADPTFGGQEFWVTRAAIDAESSGYFLVPARLGLKTGWTVASATDANSIHGKGSTNYNDPNAYTPDDDKLYPQTCNVGMCVANAMLMLVSAHLTDKPGPYVPPFGPSSQVTLTYNQREGNAPASFNYFNVGPKWSLNFMSYVEDDVAAAPTGNSALKRYEVGGGVIQYPAFGTYGTGPDGTQAWQEPKTGNSIRRVMANGVIQRYELAKADGGRYIYDKFDGATSGLRRIYLSAIVDPQGNTLTLNYDSNLRLTSIVDATRRSTTFTYAPNSRRVVAFTDPFNRTVNLEYNTNGYLSAIVDVIGMRSTFGYGRYALSTAQGNPTGDGVTYRTPGGYVVNVSVGDVPFGTSAAVGMPGGAVARSEYLVTSMTTPYGTTTFGFWWDDKTNTRYLNITDPLRNTERLEFKHQAPGISQTEPNAPNTSNGQGQTFNSNLQYRNTFYWDKTLYKSYPTDYTKAKRYHWLHLDGVTTSRLMESSKSALEGRVGYRWADGVGGPVEVDRLLDDGALQATVTPRTSAGLPAQYIDPIGREYRFSYKNSYYLTAVERAYVGNSVMMRATYNAQNRVETYTDGAGQLWSYSYYPNGQLKTATDPLQKVTTYFYDSYGRLQTVQNALGLTQVALTYDSFDRVQTATDSEGYTLIYGYDALDRIKSITYPDSTTTTYDYNRLDLEFVKDRLGRVTRYGYDANRKLTSVTDPSQRVTTYDYWENGRLKSITDPKRNVTSWEYDIQARPIAKIFADNSRILYRYYPTSGRLASITDQRGITKDFAYNADNTVSGYRYTTTSGTPNVAFTYEWILPRLSTMTDGLGTTRFAYGTFGQLGGGKLVQEDGPYTNDTIDYTYDAGGRMQTRKIDGYTESFAYDALGRMSGNTNLVGAFTLDYLGSTRQLTGMTSPTVGSNWRYGTNAKDRRLEQIGHFPRGRGYLLSSDAESRLTGLKEGLSGSSNTDAWTYDYDNSNRLRTATAFSGGAQSWQYDDSDNITNFGATSGTYNSLNQISSLGGVLYKYDAAGNLLNDGARKFAWDAENRLVRIDYLTEAGVATLFAYDGLGRRLRIVESAQTQAETRQLWCGFRICQSRSADDLTKKRYFAQGASDSSETTYFARDHLGSVRDVVSSGNGQTIASFDFDPYGRRVTASQSVDDGFAGMMYHAKSGLGLTAFRVYDPVTARWLSRDRLGGRTGKNLYVYVDGAPTMYVDPLGLWGVAVGYNAGAGFALGPGTGVEGTAGLAFDGKGNIGPFATVAGQMGAFFNISLANFSLSWNWDADTIDDLAGFGFQAEVMTFLGSVSYSPSFNSSYNQYECIDPGSERPLVFNGGSVSGGYGIGAGLAVGPTYTWVKNWGSPADWLADLLGY